ncbi:putative holliday junction resolvase [Geodermatophilus africanus]|uniref:Putative pre-16S rRNA nuclease n=1 Tax=Geodermatophilus africanus TaxID=1137993 RepID=A0A1H3I3B5_9ACTN|nr:Holliday junction resolvase RuvX [Geodermatophilus africanus]SDY22213.1 putative holliday junction resolvase [Geodermatophilus africanus]
MPSQHPDQTGPAGERPMQGRPAVPPARPRATPQRPVHHATEQIDLRAAFPPVRHETAQIDLSGGLPGGLPVPPRPRRQGRRLGIDVGTVRVGVALSDPTGTLASPLETVQRARDESDLDRIAALVVEHEVTEVIVGEPRHLSGASGASAKEARAYSRALAGRIGSVPVHLVDERLSTVTAASSLRANGVDSRRQRSVIDQAAAVVILQAYLDAQRERS